MKFFKNDGNDQDSLTKHSKNLTHWTPTVVENDRLTPDDEGHYYPQIIMTSWKAQEDVNAKIKHSLQRCHNYLD